MVTAVVHSYKAMGCNIIFRGALLTLSFRLLRKSRAVSDEDWERFHQEISTKKKRDQGKWSPNTRTPTDCCWTLRKDVSLEKCSRSSWTLTFYVFYIISV